jgi:RHS repeat-associated protein
MFGDNRAVWSAAGSLLRVLAPGDTVSYDYDAEGQPIRRTRHGTVDRYFLWDREQLLAELDGAANTRVGEYVYTLGTTDAPLAVSKGLSTDTTLHYFVQDVQGSIVGIFGIGPEQTLQLDPFGNLEAATTITADTSRLRWKGLLWEGDSTQLYYARARWYDPVTRRFMSEDPIGIEGGLNAYTFARGDHINGFDPSGTCMTYNYTYNSGNLVYTGPGIDYALGAVYTDGVTGESLVCGQNN